jgi:hypothetical protein
MNAEQKKAIVNSMLAIMKELKAEEDWHHQRAERFGAKIMEIADVWVLLDLGPFPATLSPTAKLADVLDDDAGMTERIRVMLRHSGGVMLTPTQIRDRLVEGGFSLEGRSNPLAEIHTILKRLVQKQNSRFVVEDRGGETFYGFRVDAPAKKRDKQ